MAIEGDIQTLLAALVSSRCFPIGEVPDTPISPYIVFQIVSSVSANIKATDTRKRVQVDVYAKGYNAAKVLEESVKTAMLAATFANSFLVARDSFYPDVKLNRQIMDFYAWD